MTHPMERLTDAQKRALRTIGEGRVTTWDKHRINYRTLDRLERMRLVLAEATGNVGEYRERRPSGGFQTRLTYEVAYRLTDRGRGELVWYPAEEP